MSPKTRIKEPILIVDDDPGIRDALAQVIALLDIPSLEAENASEALALLSGASPFLVISDYRMNGMDGLSFCAKLRERLPLVPFVLISGYTDKELAIAALRAGVSEIIEKPFDTKRLLQSVSHFVDRHLRANEQRQQDVRAAIETFQTEAAMLLDDSERLILRIEKKPTDVPAIDALYRAIHTLKGGIGILDGEAPEALTRVAHEFESVLSCLRQNEILADQRLVDVLLSATDRCRKLLQLSRDGKEPEPAVMELVQETLEGLRNARGAAPGSASDACGGMSGGVTSDGAVAVTNDRLDSLLGVASELVVMKNQFSRLSREQSLDRRLSNLALGLGKLTDRLQDQIMDVRKVSLSRALTKLPLQVRKLGQELQKEVAVITEGLDLRVDRAIAQALAACVTHMIRNAIDHGLESPEERGKASKPREGKLSISATEANGMVRLVLRDDGRGIDPRRVTAKAIERGLISAETALEIEAQRAFEFIFLPGFSTSETVSDVSGRGVGMDVVKSLVSSLQGTISIDSELGKGTEFRIEVPAPRSIVVENSVLVRCQGLPIAVPLPSVAHIGTTAELRVHPVNGIPACQYGGKTVRAGTFHQLTSLLRDGESQQPDAQSTATAATVLLIRHKDRMLALFADAVEDQFEAVIRPFNEIVGSVPGFRGTAVLGDETIAYVLSAEEFIPMILDEQEAA